MEENENSLLIVIAFVFIGHSFPSVLHNLNDASLNADKTLLGGSSSDGLKEETTFQC